MSDARLRELERVFRENPNPENERNWLEARMHSGEVERSMVEVAAHCGHEASQLLLAAVSVPRPLPDWFDHAIFDSERVRGRMAVTYSAEVIDGLQDEAVSLHGKRAVLRFAELVQDTEDPFRVETAMKEFHIWLDSINENHADLWHHGDIVDNPLVLACEVIRSGFGSWINDPSDWPHRDDLLTQVGFLTAFQLLLHHDENEPETYFDFEARVFQVGLEALIPWALGYKDPLVDLIARLQE